jgi:hypothetical protein
MVLKNNQPDLAQTVQDWTVICLTRFIIWAMLEA